MQIKYYQLTKGDRVLHDGEILTFHRMDGAVAQMRDSEGFTRIGSYDSYELGEDGIYVPKTDTK